MIYALLARVGSLLLGVIGVIVLWGFIGFTETLPPTSFAGPLEVLERAMTDIPFRKMLASDVSATLQRAGSGWLISLAVGAPIGVIFGAVPLMFRLFEPASEFFRAIPPVAVFPMTYAAFNGSDNGYIAAIIFGCIPLVALAVAQGVPNKGHPALETLRVAHAPGLSRFIFILLLSAPAFWLAARLSLSLAIVVAVVTEIVIAPMSGPAIGATLSLVRMDFDMESYYAYLFLIGFSGFVLNHLLGGVSTKFFSE